MENLLLFLIMAPCSALLTGLGIYAWRRKKPMWFWSGSTVEEREISDVPAYNRANGIMWMVFSVPFWISSFLGLWSGTAAGVLMIAACLVGGPALVAVYGRIYRKYKVE